ncbi:MAG: hypothetical protein ACOVPB_06605 [Bacteroidia bacterium]
MAAARQTDGDIPVISAYSQRAEIEIKKSWQPGLTEFKAKRKKYLLYTDFE